jgi:hypothetical protein
MKRRYYMASFLMIVLLASTGCAVTAQQNNRAYRVGHACDEECSEFHRAINVVAVKKEIK